MASPEKKRSSKSRKKFHLYNIDLARAATASASQRRRIIKEATGGDGYGRYKGIKANLGGILNAALPLVSGARPTKDQIKRAIAKCCNNGPGEIKGNQAVGLGLYNYVTEHNVTAASFEFEPFPLGRAGRRLFCEPYILEIDGKRYIPFFDFRGEKTRLPREGRRFVFSINHTHIRLANPTEFGKIGFVIFQFEEMNGGVRKAVPWFDNGLLFWADDEIGRMIDQVYRVLDEIKRAA
jgi:hypothetical protein